MNEVTIFFLTTVYNLIISMASNSMYDSLKKDLPDKVMCAIEQAGDAFFDNYKDYFGSREECFLSRQSNYDKIYKSIMNPYSEKIKIDDINEGYDGEPLTEDAKIFFINALYENAAKDYDLLQLIEQQKNIHDQKAFQEEIRGLRNTINQWISDGAKTGYITTPFATKLKSIDEANKLIAYKYIKKGFRNLSIINFASFSNLFKKIVSFDGKPTLSENENIFETTYHIVRDCDDTYPLILRGLAGTGKSTFLSIFYQYLLNKSKNHEYIPIYIDLHYYVESISQSIAQKFNSDLDILFSAARQLTDIDMIIIIDGVDKYFSSNIDFEGMLRNYLNGLTVKKKIISFSEPPPMLKAKEKKILHFNPNEASNTISFTSVDISETQRLDQFVEAYVETYPQRKGLKEILTSKIKEFSLTEVDLNTLTILSYCQKEFSDVSFISELYEKYCLTQLDSFEIDALKKVSQLAFEYIILEKRYDENFICINSKEWTLIHKHKSICNYLLAYYYIYCLSTYNDVSSKSLLDVLYPKEINFFIKDILNNNYDQQQSILKKTSLYYNKFGYKAKSQMCYLLGRIADEPLKAEAKEFLEGCYLAVQKSIDEQKHKKLKNEIEKSRLAFLYRTITISMVCLEGKDKCADYVDALLRDYEFSQLNDGFHLEYYGDIEYLPSKDMLQHLDNGKVQIHNTFKALVNKLQKFYDDTNHYYESSMYEINLYTLCSLVQKRLGTGFITEKELQITLQHINKALYEDSFSSKDLKPYLKMLKIDIEGKSYKPEDVYSYTYKAKKVFRKGWEDDVSEPNRENIVEHMYYTWMLGMLYLPEKLPRRFYSHKYKNYDKSKILNTILIHDIAEIDVGDKTPKEITDAHRIKEDLFMRAFLMHDTYFGISNLSIYKELWDNYRDKRADDINALLAYELDKIQALYQFYVFLNIGVEFSEERKAEWKQETAKINSPLGKEILKRVISDGIAKKRQH